MWSAMVRGHYDGFYRARIDCRRALAAATGIAGASATRKGVFRNVVRRDCGRRGPVMVVVIPCAPWYGIITARWNCVDVPAVT